MTPPTVLQAALDYIARGWSVIPVHAAAKRPLVRWQAFQERRADVEEARAWFRAWPDANVGVVTGAVSGLVVMDVDPAHGGNESLERLEREHNPLPVTVDAVTGGGGSHRYFAHPGGFVHNRVGLWAGIDLRGDGGYVVAPPSRHGSGRCYAWVEGRGPEAVPLAPLPGWLLRHVTGRVLHGHPLSHWRQLVREGVPEGQRNNTIASLAGHLLWHGVDPNVVLELLLCWNAVRCRPQLPDEEVSAVVESITRLDERQGE